MSSSPTPETVSGSALAPAQQLERQREYFVVLGLPIGFPQMVAAFLLLMFLAQCLWLAEHAPLRAMERSYLQQGLMLLQEGSASGNGVRSPLVGLLAALPVLNAAPAASAASDVSALPQYPESWRWRVRLPFMAVGLLLGASLWYVARRLYGNAGGYIALAFYVFSPTMVMGAATVQPSIVAAWGAFGLIFTAIAVAHTLYAPRAVVLWNWKRILLLGLSVVLAVGGQTALLALVAVALAFMLYLVPERRREAVIILAAGCGLGLFLLWASYRFDPHATWASLRLLRWSEFAPGLLTRGLTYELLARFFLHMPAVLVALAIALVTYALWKRARFFGTTAPLLVWGVLLVLGICLPHLGGYNLFLVSVPFAFVFLAGVFADLLEARQSGLALGVLAGVILAHAAYSIGGLLRLR